MLSARSIAEVLPWRIGPHDGGLCLWNLFDKGVRVLTNNGGTFGDLIVGRQVLNHIINGQVEIVHKTEGGPQNSAQWWINCYSDGSLIPLSPRTWEQRLKTQLRMCALAPEVFPNKLLPIIPIIPKNVPVLNSDSALYVAYLETTMDISTEAPFTSSHSEIGIFLSLEDLVNWTKANLVFVDGQWQPKNAQARKAFGAKRVRVKEIPVHLPA